MTLLLLALAACGTARRGLPSAAEVRLDLDARLGQLAYQEHCQACHPNGEAGIGPALNNRPLPGFLVRVQVRRGLGAMPAFPTSDLAEAELDGIVDYLAELRRAPAVTGLEQPDRTNENSRRPEGRRLSPP